MRWLQQHGVTIWDEWADRRGDLGRIYEAHRLQNPFSREATFYSTAEVLALLKRNGFARPEVLQTVFGDQEPRAESLPAIAMPRATGSDDASQTKRTSRRVIDACARAIVPCPPSAARCEERMEGYSAAGMVPPARRANR